MADLRPECCATCHEEKGTKRYCAPNRCYCGHKACPAYASYVDPRPMPPNVTALAPGTRFQQRAARAGERARSRVG